jgi:hypothetical protein
LGGVQVLLHRRGFAEALSPAKNLNQGPLPRSEIATWDIRANCAMSYKHLSMSFKTWRASENIAESLFSCRSISHARAACGGAQRDMAEEIGDGVQLLCGSASASKLMPRPQAHQ